MMCHKDGTQTMAMGLTMRPVAGEGPGILAWLPRQSRHEEYKKLYSQIKYLMISTGILRHNSRRLLF